MLTQDRNLSESEAEVVLHLLQNFLKAFHVCLGDS